MRINKLKIILLLLLNTLISNHEEVESQSLQTDAGGIVREISFAVTSKDSILKLPNRFIIKGSIIVRLDTILLKSGTDYVFDDHRNTLILLANLFLKLREDSKTVDTLTIKYKVLPFSFKEKYSHREIIYGYDSTSGKVIQTAKPVQPFTIQNIFGDNIQKSGSLTRGFSFGSNRDFSLSSGFRMQMSGQLSQDIDITAALTDENSPIQPEGNTQTLQEIDKVFIELKSKNLSATLGDFNIDYSGNEFGRLSRKLQGGLASAKYDAGFSKGDVLISGAVTRGKYHTNKFNGIEGVQGPYRLVGKNNERTIIIIAGTEKVYLDGEPVKRGEENDYTIDYALAELTFSSRRLVNGNSRIVVDFEYTDRQYVRNFFTARGNSNFFNDNFTLNTSFVREGDDFTNLIDLTLSEADKESLKLAGDNSLKATLNGVQFVGQGKGQYLSVDTLIDTNRLIFYRFAPGDSNASYSINFSYVGEGKGDYIKINIGNYQYVGKNNGNYLPVRFLPLPQVQSLINADINSQVAEYLRVSGEAAISDFDANRFSSIDDSDNKGSAYKLGIFLNPKNVVIGNTNLGAFDLRLKRRFITAQFNPIDRINDIEFDRRWNLASVNKSEELINEGEMIYSPINSIKVGGGFGKLKQGKLFSSDRYEGVFLLNDISLPRVNYKYEKIISKETGSDIKGDWDRHNAEVEYTKSYFTPSFKYEHERRELHSIGFDTLKLGSFSFDEYSPKLLMKNIFNSTFAVEYKWRTENRFNMKRLMRESNAFTQIYSLSVRPISNLSSNIDLTLRNRKYAEEFRSIAGGNSETVLLRTLTKYSGLNRSIETDLFYDVATQKSAKLERVFRRVQRGEGNYSYLGDLDSNGIATENEFRPVRFDGDYILLTIPSEKLFPVVDLKFNARVKFVPSRFISTDDWYAKGISALSSKTYFRMDEKSSEENQRKIYTLNLKYFMNEITTIVGNRSITQDLFLFEQSPIFSARLRYQQRIGLVQYALATERNYRRERSVRIRWQLIKEIANQTDYENKRDQLTASVYNYRVMNINSEILNSDWTYRPDRQIELGFRFGVGRSKNITQFSNAVSDMNLQGVRFIYSFAEQGIVKAELNREEIQLTGVSQYIPFELTGGRVVGKTWIVRIASEYRITDFLQASFNYEGRSETNLRQVHTLRGEIRAFF
ncbi:MAG: hypothetical protein KJ963_04455 [Bacteroidetes bacterium]|nr:hypothetical protein [Bacteroidota bacterium]MBU1423333.1 hypothetical protein [Bacteroidota bacterium]MBU2636321.1 hypothetical protein [Bacteroidota bacterium]